MRLLGYREDIADVFAAADVFALPSLGEAYGIAVAEALQAGLPVIATDAGAMREIVEEAVRDIAGDAHRRNELATRARSASLPDPRELVARIGEVYRSVSA